MDYQEAIEVLSNHERYVGVKYVNGVEEAYVTPYFEKALSAAISSIQELREYKQLGTMEEVRDAMERQKKKKPIEDSHHGIRYTEVYRCPSCNGIFSGRGLTKYCFHCGQAIDWGDEE